ncbi:MAG TPA: hypothetical protein VE868_11915 [Balneolaceae bacterium]|nr:hypothetical protein [Balneolaceae bacterium]
MIDNRDLCRATYVIPAVGIVQVNPDEHSKSTVGTWHATSVQNVSIVEIS